MKKPARRAGVVAMGKKPNYDLTNVGGQPKDWQQRSAEYDRDFSWWGDVKMSLGGFGIPLLLLASLGLTVYGLLQIIR